MEHNEITSIHNHTIVALATPPIASALSIIRLSGKNAISIADNIFKGKHPLSNTKSHTARFGTIVNADATTIDQCVATVFRAPHSFTGEDCVEFSLHGSPWIAKTTIQLLIHAGAIPAERGEFSMRAFLNGKIDLTQAEAIADIIASSSENSNKLAINQMKGKFSQIIKKLSEKLLHAATMLELELDFSEEDVTFANRSQLNTLLYDINNTLTHLAQSYKTGKIIKEGIPIAIIGQPNAGKSTLLNHLAGDNKAIVSTIPGTTRDTIEETIDIHGTIYRIIDTAGIRQANDEIEKIGVEKSILTASKAQLTIILLDATQQIDQQIEDIQKSLNNSIVPQNTLYVINKKDINQNKNDNYPYLQISAKTGNGITQLKNKIKEITIGAYHTDTDILITNARHYQAIIESLKDIDEAIQSINSNQTSDIITFHLRNTLRSLATITGEITSTNILHNIFKNFCIGK